MTSRPLVSRDFRRWRTTIARCLLLAWTLLLWSPCLVGLAAPVTDDQKDLAQVSDLDYPKDRWLTDEGWGMLRSPVAWGGDRPTIEEELKTGRISLLRSIAYDDFL
ncbi:hypothetical protein RRG08_023386 [Elysia crispata]|uniref:Uncharacterized protein n=1 Tax=Elysia crispata TaxID=231223 RepID=A0AAE1EE99_9GAST|nr:hypothetical protein RRG08_023386 [Elysia crispata]